MNLADELSKLRDLHAKGALTDDELAAAKAHVLAQESSGPAVSSKGTVERHLQTIALQNDIAQLDREWELARDSYMVAGKHCQRYIPSQGGSLVTGVVLILFGAVWTTVAFAITSQSPFGPMAQLFPIFGIVFIVFGVGRCWYSFDKAGEYAEAERRYRERRSELLARDNGDPRARTNTSDWG
jgi:hypothetical protein